MTPPDRPLTLGELLSETIGFYTRRPRAAFGIGLVFGAAYLLTALTPALLDVLVIAFTFSLVFGAAARLVSGDSFAEAWAQVALRAAVLLVLTFLVAVPAFITFAYLFLFLLGAAWIAFLGFAIPVAMLERDPEVRNVFDRIAYSLLRSIQLARAEYLHALGVVAALVIIYLVLGLALAVGLVGFADNGRVVAAALVQVVLGPFFAIGLSVLYYEQGARAAVSSPPEAA